MRCVQYVILFLLFISFECSPITVVTLISICPRTLLTSLYAFVFGYEFHFLCDTVHPALTASNYLKTIASVAIVLAIVNYRPLHIGSIRLTTSEFCVYRMEGSSKSQASQTKGDMFRDR
jgi:hypothetical protein